MPAGQTSHVVPFQDALHVHRHPVRSRPCTLLARPLQSAALEQDRLQAG
jgi:hypothetical protein